jgi:hypothetical protein
VIEKRDRLDPGLLLLVLVLGRLLHLAVLGALYRHYLEGVKEGRTRGNEPVCVFTGLYLI